MDYELDRHAQEQRTHHAVREAAGKFAAHMEDLRCNADLRTVVLTANAPTQTDMSGTRAVSIGVLNPNAITVYWGIGGATPKPGQRAIAQPAKSLLVLPLSADDLDFGAAPADLAVADAPLFVMRFATAQPCFLGAAA